MECLDLRIYCVWLDELVTIRFCFHSTEIIFSRNIYLLKMRLWSTISHYLFVMMLCERVWLYKLTAGDRMDVSINRKIKINDYRNVLCLCCGNDVEKYEFTYLEAQRERGTELSRSVIFVIESNLPSTKTLTRFQSSYRYEMYPVWRHWQWTYDQFVLKFRYTRIEDKGGARARGELWIYYMQ